LLVIIEGFLKLIKLYPCTTINTIKVIKLTKDYFRCNNKLRLVVSDCLDGTSVFTSNAFQEFLTKIKLMQVATITPHANGHVGRIN